MMANLESLLKEHPLVEIVYNMTIPAPQFQSLNNLIILSSSSSPLDIAR